MAELRQQQTLLKTHIQGEVTLASSECTHQLESAQYTWRQKALLMEGQAQSKSITVAKLQAHSSQVCMPAAPGFFLIKTCLQAAFISVESTCSCLVCMPAMSGFSLRSAAFICSESICLCVSTPPCLSSSVSCAIEPEAPQQRLVQHFAQVNSFKA